MITDNCDLYPKQRPVCIVWVNLNIVNAEVSALCIGPIWRNDWTSQEDYYV